MQEKAKIVKIVGNIITVMPLDIEVCIGCQNTECKTNGSLFSAINTKNFPIKIGSEVKVVAPVKNQFIQAFFAVGFPVVLAVGAFQLLPLFVVNAGEGMRIGAALLFLLVGALVFFQIRKHIKADLPEIVAVLDGNFEITDPKDVLF